MADINDFASIPGMPSDDSIRADLARTAGPAYWRPSGKPDGTATDFSALSPEAAEKVLGSRLSQGPGPHGTPYQHAVFDHHQKIIDLEKQEQRLMERLTEIKGYDRDTGQAISAMTADQIERLSWELTAVQRQASLLRGEGGRIRLERELETAVGKVKERIRREYIQSEAKRRAAAGATEDEINRLAANYRKTL